MASTAIKTEEEKREYFDDPETLDAKVTQLAEWVRESQNMSVFTGAGISTSTGIPDYRSGYGTVLETGPGWSFPLSSTEIPTELGRSASGSFTSNMVSGA